MTAPITAARTGGVSFRVAGIPVTIHLTFLLVIAFLGFNAGGLDRVAVWVAVATAAVLVHELGHAVVGRLAGLQPRIDLAGFGGVTSWSAHQHGRGRGGLGRGWSLAISLAGPFTGFAGGLVALAFGAPCCTIPAGGDLGAFAAGVWLFASFGWGILNLLPILPLDGGQALRELLPGTPAQRLQRAAAVGVVAGGALVAWALVNGQTFLALLAGWIAWSNVQQVQAARGTGTDSPTSKVAAVQDAARSGDAAAVVGRSAELYAAATEARARQFAVLMHVQGLLSAGRTHEAYRTVVDPRRDVALPTELVGAVVGRHPDRREVDTVARGWAARATDREARGLAAVVLASHDHHEEVLTLLRGASGDPPVVEAGVGVTVQTAAHRAGHHATAAAIGEALLGPGGLHSPVLAYNTACSLARAGRTEDAVRTLSSALRLGFSDLDLLAGDDDLAPLHDHPAWPRLRQGEPAPDPRGDRT